MKKYPEKDFDFVFVKAYNIPEKYMRGLKGKKFAVSKNKKVNLLQTFSFTDIVFHSDSCRTSHG